MQIFCPVCLSVMLQKALLLMDVFILVYLYFRNLESETSNFAIIQKHNILVRNKNESKSWCNLGRPLFLHHLKQLDTREYYYISTVRYIFHQLWNALAQNRHNAVQSTVRTFRQMSRNQRVGCLK